MWESFRARVAVSLTAAAGMGVWSISISTSNSAKNSQGGLVMWGCVPLGLHYPALEWQSICAPSREVWCRQAGCQCPSTVICPPRARCRGGARPLFFVESGVHGPCPRSEYGRLARRTARGIHTDAVSRDPEELRPF